MDPFSIVGLTASIATLTGITIKIAHDLDTLKEKWNQAELKIIAVRTQILTLKTSFGELRIWMNNESWKDDSSENFRTKLAESIEGCAMLLFALHMKVSRLVNHPEKPTRRDKMMVLWGESEVKEISDSLDCQASALSLLIQCRNMSQQEKLFLEPTRTVMEQMSENTAFMRELQQKVIGNDDVDRDDASALISLFDPEDSDGNPLHPASYSEYFMEQFEALQLSPSIVNIDSTEAVDPFDEIASIASRSSSQPTNQDSLRSSNSGTTSSTDSALDILGDLRTLPASEIEALEKALPAVPALDKFRVLIIGHSGVGKSTLCGKILGIDETTAGVSNRGVGTPMGKIWEEITFPGQNDNLILHDSGGFEAGSQVAMDEIDKFIKSRSKETTLSKQIHCIWYCISCATPRPIQEAERLFFGKVNIDSVPIIVVFTKYDKLVQDHFMEWMDGPEAEDYPPSKGRKIAAERALEDWNVNYKGELLGLLGENSNKMGICRLGFSRGTETMSDANTTEPLGTPALVAETLKFLNDERLRTIWMRVQKSRVDYLIEASIDSCIEYYWTIRKYRMATSWPAHITSFGATMLLNRMVLKKILSVLSSVWKIKSNPLTVLEEELSKTFQQWAKERVYHESSMMLSLKSEYYLDIIVMYTIIFEQLFWIQHAEGDQGDPLTGHIVRSEAQKVLSSTTRSFCGFMYTSIWKRLNVTKEEEKKRALIVINMSKTLKDLHWKEAKIIARKERRILDWYDFTDRIIKVMRHLRYLALHLDVGAGPECTRHKAFPANKGASLPRYVKNRRAAKILAMTIRRRVKRVVIMAVYSTIVA